MVFQFHVEFIISKSKILEVTVGAGLVWSGRRLRASVGLALSFEICPPRALLWFPLPLIHKIDGSGGRSPAVLGGVSSRECITLHILYVACWSAEHKQKTIKTIVTKAKEPVAENHSVVWRVWHVWPPFSFWRACYTSLQLSHFLLQPHCWFSQSILIGVTAVG